MVNKRLKQLADKKLWKVEKTKVYGEDNGYIFTAAVGQGFIAFLTLLPTLDDTKRFAIQDYLKENKKNLSIWQFSMDKKTLVIKFKNTAMRPKAETMEDTLYQLTEFLKSNQVSGKDYCPICGNAGPDQKVMLEGIYTSIHNDCYLKMQAELEEAVKVYNSETKNYGLGALGALIGGLVCSIPWILVAVYLNRVAAMLACLIGLGSFKCYQLFKGKMGPATRWIICFITLISVAFAELAILGVELVREGFLLSVRNYQVLLTDPSVSGTVWGNFAMGIFMAILGIIPVFTSLNGKAKNVLPSIEKKMD